MHKAAITIGVNKTGNLPKLDSAAASALLMKSWLKKQGFEVKSFTDAKGKEVRSGKLFSQIRKIVDTGAVEQLVVYFSGHGFLNDGSEFWMLSGAPENPNEAVSLKECEMLARDCGIPHVVFISDACRSTPGSLQADRVSGSVIFPNTGADPNVDPEIDRFLAALPGDPAYEMALDDSAPQYQSIYTHCFLNAYSKPDPDMVREIALDDGRIKVVPNRRLKKYLRREVNAMAERKSILYRQKPQSIIESGEETYLGRVSDTPPTAGFEPAGTLRAKGWESEQPPLSVQDLSALALSNATDGLYAAPDIDIAEAVQTSEAAATANEFDQSVNIVRDAEGRGHFETETGVTVHGIGLHSATASRMTAELESPGSGAPQPGAGDPGLVRLHLVGPSAASVLLRFDDGSGTVIAGLAGYIATVIVERGQVINVSYVPSDNSSRWHDYQGERQYIDRLRSVVAAAVRHGTFTIGRDASGPMADRIRVGKALDPTLGLYASYAYADAGLRKKVESVGDYMRSDLGADIFDVAMLSRQLADGTDPDTIAPFCPMLSQGWGLLRVMATRLPGPVTAAGEHRREALWTTFRQQGMDILEAAMTQGEIT